MKDEIQYFSHEFRAKQDETERVKFGQHLTVNWRISSLSTKSVQNSKFTVLKA